jgi:two-component system, NarL family, invasion response regulator UvrY
LLRIIAADNEPIALRGLTEIMREGFPGSTVDGALSGRETVDRIERVAYDLAIIGMSYADMDGIEVLRQIKKSRPGLPILVMSEYPEEQWAMHVIKAGGNGYLTKQSACHELVGAAHKVLSGKRYIDPAFAERMAFGSESLAGRPPHEKLSNRELQVACMIGKGKTTRAINEELRLSINTVRTYRARIMRKIGLRGTNELIHYVAKHFLAR